MGGGWTRREGKRKEEDKGGRTGKDVEEKGGKREKEDGGGMEGWRMRGEE